MNSIRWTTACAWSLALLSILAAPRPAAHGSILLAVESVAVDPPVAQDVRRTDGHSSLDLLFCSHVSTPTARAVSLGRILHRPAVLRPGATFVHLARAPPVHPRTP